MPSVKHKVKATDLITLLFDITLAQDMSVLWTYFCFIVTHSKYRAASHIVLLVTLYNGCNEAEKKAE